ncbi:MAG: hypothetical protein HY980_04360 [Candidatus Magasanikbacteria bacterium]|nr:hypothetical protein [Candidatus Magasanikbacteria bacterium]
MKNYSSNRAQKGKTAYRTPSRWIKNRPESFKKAQGTKLNDLKPYFQRKSDNK